MARAREQSQGGVNTEHVDRKCPVCHRMFRARPAKRAQDEAVHCGARDCIAMSDWGDAEWEGRSRMAKARRAANRGVVADLIDREALRRFP